MPVKNVVEEFFGRKWNSTVFMGNTPGAGDSRMVASRLSRPGIKPGTFQSIFSPPTVNVQQFIRWIARSARGQYGRGDFMPRLVHAAYLGFGPALEFLLRIFRGSPGLRYVRGFYLAAGEDYPGAIADLKFAIRKWIERGQLPSARVLAIGQFYVGQMALQQGQYEEAEKAFEEALKLKPDWGRAHVNLGQTRLALDKEEEAVRSLLKGISVNPKFGMAHQNLAARYDRFSYVPTALDRAGRRDIALYDAYNLTGERFTHRGRCEEGVEFFARALRIQRNLSENFRLPDDIVSSLSQMAGFEPALPVRILPYEWVTQIGHLGYLDTYCKIQKLGWREEANNVILAPPAKVANPLLLDYWRQYFLVVSDAGLVNQLFPYQRHIGDCFNASLDEQGKGISWCDLGARAHIAWDASGRGPLLRLSEEHRQGGRKALKEMGLPDDAWFVAMHARDSGFYREGITHTQSHRNAPIESYYPAINYITSKGGWVIRMGDSGMAKMDRLEQVIDYAHSPLKRDWIDVFLWSESRFFLGTTSGPTNVAVAFGTPCALVNCISNYSQLWNNRVSFSLKPFWSQKQERFLNLSEFASEPTRGKIFNLKVLADDGIYPVDNSAEDIVDVVTEMLEQLDTDKHVMDSHGLSAFKAQTKGMTLWGNARPSARFFEKNKAKFFG